MQLEELSPREAAARALAASAHGEVAIVFGNERTGLENDEISFDGPGGKITINKNHHATKNVYIGETRANGQFKILKSFDQVFGEPFLLKGLDEKLTALNK